MINLIETNASNIASIPPPKRLRRVKAGSRLFLDSAAPESGGPKHNAKSVTARSPFLMDWEVPDYPATCLAKALRTQWRVYRKQLKTCQKEFSETSVHQLRVATRRLMTYYALAGAVVSDDKVSKARKKLKRHLKSLGKLRDAQVQRIFIEDQMPRFPFLDPIRDFLREREHFLVREIAGKVGHFKSRKLEQWTLDLCTRLRAWPKQTEKREQFGRDLFRAMADAFTQTAYSRKTIDASDVQTLHRTRVAFKKFRYMVEALSPDFTGLNKRQLRRFGTYQRRMGNLQDLEILQECVSRFLQEQPAHEQSFVPFCRFLDGLQSRTLRACLKHADDLFEFWDGARLEREFAPQSCTAA
jgi:CHAD domain-containing protein